MWNWPEPGGGLSPSEYSILSLIFDISKRVSFNSDCWDYSLLTLPLVFEGFMLKVSTRLLVVWDFLLCYNALAFWSD